MKATFEEGTELIVDQETLALKTGWTDGGASTVSRHGDTVTVSLHLAATARAPWAEKSKYALGTLVTEGGKTYVLIAAEPEAEKAKPTTDAGVHWEEVVAPLTVATLPADFRPPAEVGCVKQGTPTVKIGADGTVKVSAAENVDALTAYAAAGITP